MFRVCRYTPTKNHFLQHPQLYRDSLIHLVAVKKVAQHESALFVCPTILERSRDVGIVVNSKEAHFPRLGIWRVDCCGKSPTRSNEASKVLVCGDIYSNLLQELSASILQS